MIVLDTNVISELFKPIPHQPVLAWIERQLDDALFTTAITRGELLVGVHSLPEGRRKDGLLHGLTRILDNRFVGRVLAYDDEAASTYAAIAAARRAAGRPIDLADAMIAGIVRAHGATLATRNVRDFGGCGITLIDPWH